MWMRDNQQDISKADFQAKYPKLAEHLLDKSLDYLTKKHQLFLFPNDLKDIPDLDLSGKIFETVKDKIRTRNIVGFMGFMGFKKESLRIHSRFAQNDEEDYFLHYMLQKVLHLNLTNLDTSLSTDQQFYQLLLYLFPKYLQAALRKGLYKEYQRFHYHDSNVKGALDVARHIKYSTPFVGKIAYTTREFSYENDLMQLIRHTIEWIKVSQKNSQQILTPNLETRKNIDAIVQVTSSYDLSDRRKIIFKNRQSPVRHAYFHEYAALQRLCLLILKGQEQSFGSGSEQIHGMLFDVAWLWEEYLATLLGSQFLHPRNKDRSGGYSLFNKGNGLIYPDFLSFSPMPIVADAKYKPFENIKGTDYLQLVAYMYRFDAKLGFYLFPNATTEQHSQQFELLQGKGQKREDKIIVEKLGLTIPQQMTSFEAFVHTMQENEAQFLERIQLEM